jgi:segregation and condensation protein B
MRQKRKARGEAARSAADALAEQAGDALEITDDLEGAEAVADGEAEPVVDGDAEPALEAAGDAGSDVAEPGASEAGDEPDEPEEPDEAEELEADADAELASVPPAEGLDPGKLKSLVEALLFASEKPLPVTRLRQLTRTSDTARLQAIVEELQADYADRGLVLQEVSGGYLFRTHHQFSTWVQQLVQGRPVRLSRAQLETLALVAYRQPITRPEIDQIRGVDSGGTLKILLDRSLVRMLGKKEEVGRPLLYGTTREFLDFFSLRDLRELPTLREYSELSEESLQVVERLSAEADAEASGDKSSEPEV